MADHYENGRLYLERNRPKKALEECHKALEVDPEDANVYALIGLSYIDLGEFDKSMEAAKTGIGIDPEIPFFFYILAFSQLGKKNYKQALEYIDEALKMDPWEETFFGLQAEIYARMKNWPKSLEAAENGLEVDPEDEDCLNLRAKALIQLGRKGEADESLDAALLNNPEDPETHKNKALALLHKGNVDRAIEHYREALRLDPASRMARAGLIESLKGRNPLYRISLKMTLWFSKMNNRQIFKVLIGVVVARYLIEGIADTYPATGVVLWPVFYASILFFLVVHISDEIFNALLMFDHEGRHLLSRKEILQANMFLGILAITLITSVLWLLGIPGMGMGSLFIFSLVFPVTQVCTVENPKHLVFLSIYSLLLIAAVCYIIVLDYQVDSFRNEWRPHMDTFEKVMSDSDDPEEILKNVKKLPVEDQMKLMIFMKESPAVREKDTREADIIGYYVWGWVAYAWVALILAMKER